jgi:serine/threonine protein kinase
VPEIQIKKVPTQGEFSGNGYELPSSETYEVLKVPYENISLGSPVGEGNFGCVFLAEVKDLIATGVTSIVAVKMLQEGYTDKDMMDLVREMEMMRIVGKHNNIVNLLGCCTKGDGELMVIVECTWNGSLENYLKGFRLVDNYGVAVQRTPEELFKLVGVLIHYAWQIACGMEYLASKKVKKIKEPKIY